MTATKNTPIIRFNDVLELEDFFVASKKAGLPIDGRNVYRGKGGVYAICEVEPLQTDGQSWFMINSCEGYTTKDTTDCQPLVIFIG